MIVIERVSLDDPCSIHVAGDNARALAIALAEQCGMVAKRKGRKWKGVAVNCRDCGRQNCGLGEQAGNFRVKSDGCKGFTPKPAMSTPSTQTPDVSNSQAEIDNPARNEAEAAHAHVRTWFGAWPCPEHVYAFPNCPECLKACKMVIDAAQEGADQVAGGEALTCGELPGQTFLVRWRGKRGTQWYGIWQAVDSNAGWELKHNNQFDVTNWGDVARGMPSLEACFAHANNLEAAAILKARGEV